MSGKLFTDLGLSPESLKAIARLGFEQPSPIQAEAIPVLMTGSDLVGQSQTGSGKTAAFALPAIERIDPAIRAAQVLILCNTRELAIQVSEETHKLAFFKPGVRPLPIYGGQSYDRQISGLRAGMNIIIGTPGRVMDHMRRRTLALDQVRMVILDEADEMLNMGFRDDIEFILAATPKTRQTVLFSATIPRAIEELIARHTREPRRIRIDAKAMTVPTVEQAYIEVDRRWKTEALERLIDLHDIQCGLVFCNTQRMVDELAESLNAAGYAADAIHGGMAQLQRDRVMKKFKAGGSQFLVATDIAARGIDVENIQVVFNFDLPYDGEDYVHRIGRTGRAGKGGLAISFVSGRDRFAIQQIERFTRTHMRRIEVPTHGEIEEARLNQLAQSVRKTIGTGDFRHYDHLIEGLLEEGIDSLDLANALLHQLYTSGQSPQPGQERRPDDKPGSPPPPTARPVPKLSRPPAERALPSPAGASMPTAPSTPQPPAQPPVHKPVPKPAHKPAPKPAPPAHAAGPRPPGPGPAPAQRATPPWKAMNAARPSRPAGDASTTEAAASSRSESRPPFPKRQHAPPPPQAEERPGKPAIPFKPEGAAKPSRAPGENMTRVWIGIGEEHQVGAEDVRTCIRGETGLSLEALGTVDVRKRHTFVDVATEHVQGVVAKLKRAQFGGRNIKAKIA